MAKAGKWVAPGLSVEEQISTKYLGNLSLGGQLELHENVPEEAIDAYLIGSNNSTIKNYFDAQMDAFKKISSKCSSLVQYRWIRNLIHVFCELFLTGEGEENAYHAML